MRSVNQLGHYRHMSTRLNRLASNWVFLFAVTLLAGCDMLKIEEESTTPSTPVAPAQTAAPPAPPPPPPAPPVVPPEKIAEQIITEFYKLTPDQINDRTLEKLASIYDPAKGTIEKLNLQNSQVTGGSFESIKQFPNLKDLNISMTRIPKETMINLKDLKNLEVVNLGHTGADNEVIQLLVDIPSIRSIDLNETPINDDALGILDTFQNLERLSVAGVAGIDGGGFRNARKLSQLKVLVLNKTGVVDPAMAIINKYPLVELHMAACPYLTDKGISKLVGMKELKYLNLRDSTNLSSRGLSYLAKNPKLWAINLANIRGFDDKGLAPFAKSKTLKHIDLSGTGCSDQAKLALQKAIPDITFTMPY